MAKRLCALLVVTVGTALPRATLAAPPPAATVWAIDDGEKIKQDATSLPFAGGTDNPVWSPGQPIRLFALQNETIAFQIVVQADGAALDGVTVDLASLAGPGGASIGNDPGATDPASFVGRRIERFVEHFFDVSRPSGGSDPSSSLGWAAGSGPSPDAWTGRMPDALIPVEVAPSWDPYPMHVDVGRNALVWIDVTVPATQAPGLYTGTVAVAAGGGAIASIPVELQVAGALLPDRPVQTMLYYDRSELDRRIGDGAAAEAYLWKLYHRHRLSAMHGAQTAADVQAHLPALDGSAYTAQSGYEGPGVGLGDGILSLGTYGAYGQPGAAPLAQVEGVADVLASHGLFKGTDVFVYAIDETCGSSYGADWKSLLAGSSDPNAKDVRVGWTCSEDPMKQAVDVPIVFADSFDPATAAAADAAGKSVWIYNGSRPQTDAFLTDTSAIALRANGWIAAMASIPRWFYWETTFWYDDNHGGLGAYDPFTTAETFHNSSGDYCEGDGVLVYPGKQVDVFTEHSVGVSGVLPSIRLKNMRRGVEDAGYLQLASAADPAKAHAIAAALLPAVLSATSSGAPVAWPERGAPWFEARKALLALIPQQPAAPAPPTPPSPPSPPSDGGASGGADAGAPPPAAPPGSPADGSTPSSSAETASSGGCAVATPAGAPLWLAVAALAALLRRRRSG
jgi:MYXO-CTERM domain-containing protein